jgi:signal transduction histidine kinase
LREYFSFDTAMNKLFYKYLTPLLILSIIPILASGMLIFILTTANFNNLQKKLVGEITVGLREEILAKNLAMATSEGKFIEEVIDKIGNPLGVLAVSPDFQKFNVYGISDYADNIMGQNIPILEFKVINEWGEEVYRKENSFALNAIYTKPMSDEVFKRAKAEKKSIVSDVRIAENTQQPYVILGQPILDYGGAFKGVLMVTLNLGFISDMLSNKDDNNATVFIISKDGMLISHPSMFELTQNLDYAKYDYIKNILKKKSGNLEFENKLYSFYTIKYGWTVIIEIPNETALASIEQNKSTINAFIKITLNAISYSIVIIIILAIAVCIIVAIFFTNRTIQPILELTQATKKISHGDFRLNLENTSKDEIGQLTDSFNLMAQEIAQKQEELIKSNEYVKQQADELLTRYNSDLEQFAYVTTHDLIEPLRMITSYTQLLQRRYSGKLEGDAREFMGYITEGVQRMHKIINDLFEYSHIRTNESDFQDCNGVMDDVLKKLEAEIAESKARIITDKLPKIKAVKSNIVQVFQNLIGNAIKFRSPDRPLEIHISCSTQGNEWLFKVQDNGIGFDPKYADKVFEIFKRLNKREQYPGSGMGLAICKNIVERHGGKIWVEPILEKGTTFYFTIRKNISRA